jgi:O-antigen/teichoic acid export membrane protein
MAMPDNTTAPPETPTRRLSFFWNSATIAGGRSVAMLLGFFFWAVAAHAYAPEYLGLATAAVSAAMLCTQVAMLGVGSAVTIQLPDYKDRRRNLFDAAFSIVILAALTTAAVLLIVFAYASESLSRLSSDPLFVTLFVGTCVFSTALALVDFVSVAVRRGDQVLVRGIAVGAINLAVLGFLALSVGKRSPVPIFIPWFASTCAVIGIAMVQLWRSNRYCYHPRLHGGIARSLIGVGLPNYALTVTERAAPLLLPVVATALFSPRDGAVWYVIWMMAWVVYQVPMSLGSALLAEAVDNPPDLRETVARGIRSTLYLGIPAAIGVSIVGPSFLRLLGPDYADNATALRVLVWGFLPLTFVQCYFALCRAGSRLVEGIVVGAISASLAVAVAATAGTQFDLTGMAAGWVATQVLVGCWSFVRLRERLHPGPA